jgi:hypothetical protein
MPVGGLLNAAQVGGLSGHQAPGAHTPPPLAARQWAASLAIKRIVQVAEEGTRAAIAALRDMVRMSGNDDTGEAGHAA